MPARRGAVLSRLLAIEQEGRRLDRFELVAELATGGMATVYLARLSGVGGFQRFVAIKRLHPHLAREPEFIQMFLDEARLAARIHHPNVVPILEIGTSEDGYYIVMEYVEGDTLGRLLARSAQTAARLPVEIGVRIVVDMLGGLDAAHELRDDDGRPLDIVHRDVSPQNVLVGVDGSARLTDFGVARATTRLSTTRTGQLKGKLAYMAPEQARGAKDIDRRADVFASGIVLWEVLACRRLFKGEGEADTLNRVLNEPIPALRSAAPDAPAELEQVVTKALERERSKRYATAAEFADVLERAARQVGVLGTHKQVAAYLDAVLGTEITQQRETVRAWLSRSEPSQRGGRSLPPPPEADLVTRVEGKSGSYTPASLSAVGPAVISTRPGEPAGAPAAGVDAAASARAPRRVAAWGWALFALAAAVGAVVWARVHASAGPAPPSVAPPSGVGATVVVPPAPGTVAPTPGGATSADSATSEAPGSRALPSASAPRSGPRAPRPPRAEAPQGASRPAPPGAGTTGPGSVPDDISRNPYR